MRICSLPAAIVLLTQITSGYVFSQAAPKAVYAEANGEYRKGNYVRAEDLYKQLLRSGFSGSDLYYNIGNACYKEKKLGEAIYYWEKARRLSPGDRDIRENLELANLLIVDRIEKQSPPLPVKMILWFQSLMTAEQESTAVLFLFVAANILFSIHLVRRRSGGSMRALRASAVVGALFLILVSSLGWKVYETEYRKTGIILARKAEVRSGPGLQNMTVFTVHEGTRAKVHESSAGWSLVSLENGWSGWLQQQEIRLLK